QERAHAAPNLQDETVLSQALSDADALGPISTDLMKRQGALARRSQTLKESVTSLGIPGGSISTLRELAAPGEKVVVRFAKALAHNDDERKDLETERSRLKKDLARTEKEIAALKASGSLPT